MPREFYARGVRKTMVEALACGTPVVAFANQVGRMIFLNTRKTVTWRNIYQRSMARGIEWGIAKELDVDFLRKSVLSRFSSAAVADSYIRLYQNLTA